MLYIVILESTATGCFGAIGRWKQPFRFIPKSSFCQGPDAYSNRVQVTDIFISDWKVAQSYPPKKSINFQSSLAHLTAQNIQKHPRLSDTVITSSPEVLVSVSCVEGTLQCDIVSNDLKHQYPKKTRATQKS